MFDYEKDMIPVLIEALSHRYRTKFLTTEFSTGNGVADIVFTTHDLNDSLFLNDYATTSIYVNHFRCKKSISRVDLYNKCKDKAKLNKLINALEENNYIYYEKNYFNCLKEYKPHTKNLISIEVKLKDWKSGFYQALRYKFYSHKSFLAFPEAYIHRVDKDLLIEYNIGLISVNTTGIKILFDPKSKKPDDLTSYFFLSESFANNFK